MAIFTWRLLAKSLLHVILPPIFRFLSRLVFPLSLPHRRFYTPATDYTSVPSDFAGVNGGRGGAALGMGLGRAVPSVIDLSAIGEEEEEEERGRKLEAVRSRSNASRNDDKAVGLGLGLGASSPLARYGDGNRIGVDDGETNDRLGEGEVKDKYGEPVKHYDADGKRISTNYAHLSRLLITGRLHSYYEDDRLRRHCGHNQRGDARYV